MAIDFGNTIMEGGIEPSVRVQAPVQAPAPDRSGEVLANSMGGVAETIGSIAGSIFKQSQVDASTKVLTGYENELLDIADAIDQGVMEKEEGMLKARNLRRKYLSNAPALQTEFDKVWSNFAGANGLGHVVVEGTVEQQGIDAANKEAAQLGYTPQEYKVFQARSREAVALSQSLEIIKAEGGIVTESMKNRATNTIIGLADSAFPAAQTQINQAMEQIRANPENTAAIAAQLNLSLNSSIAGIKDAALNSDASYIVEPIEKLLTTFNDWSTGSVETSVMEGAIKNVGLQYQMMYNSDPVIASKIAKSALLNDLGLANTKLGIGMWDVETIKKLEEIDKRGAVSIIDNSPESARYVENIRKIAGSLTSSSSPEVIQETTDNLNAIIDGAYVNERSNTEGALGYKDTVETLGSPEVRNLIELGGGVSAEHADKLVGILEENYASELVPAIQQYWETVPVSDPSKAGVGAGNSGGVTNIPMSQLLKPVWNGSAVEFVPSDQYAGNPRVQSIADQANSGDNSMGVPLNNLINAQANVTGVDAKTVWEQNFAGRIFNQDGSGNPLVDPDAPVEPAKAPTPAATNVADPITSTEGLAAAASVNPHELTLEDFNPDPVEARAYAERSVEQTSAVDAPAVVDATNPVAFAEAFIGKNENNAEDVQILSAFIQNTAGIKINPAQTAWCAAFVDAVLHASTGTAGTGKLNARSYLDWGKPVSTPQVGDVEVFSRGDPNGWQGHVGFYAGMNADGTIKVLGGNQGDSVSIDNFDASKLLGYRRAI